MEALKETPREAVSRIMREDYGVQRTYSRSAFDLAGGWEAFPFRVVFTFAHPDLRWHTMARCWRTEAEAVGAFDALVALAPKLRGWALRVTVDTPENPADYRRSRFRVVRRWKP